MLSSVRLKYTVLHVVRMGTVLIGILLIVWWFREVCEGVLGMFIGNTDSAYSLGSWASVFIKLLVWCSYTTEFDLNGTEATPALGYASWMMGWSWSPVDVVLRPDIHPPPCHFSHCSHVIIIWGSQQGIFCMRSSNQTAKIFCSFCFYLFICKSVLCNSLG